MLDLVQVEKVEQRHERAHKQQRNKQPNGPSAPHKSVVERLALRAGAEGDAKVVGGGQHEVANHADIVHVVVDRGRDVGPEAGEARAEEADDEEHAVKGVGMAAAEAENHGDDEGKKGAKRGKWQNGKKKSKKVQ